MKSHIIILVMMFSLTIPGFAIKCFSCTSKISMADCYDNQRAVSCHIHGGNYTTCKTSTNKVTRTYIKSCSTKDHCTFSQKRCTNSNECEQYCCTGDFCNADAANTPAPRQVWLSPAVVFTVYLFNFT